eukprot:764642-Hanusia_phi.AAC.3
MGEDGAFGKKRRPVSFTLWGPYTLPGNSPFCFAEDTDFVVHNLCGKVDFQWKCSEEAWWRAEVATVFQPSVLPCLDKYFSYFGTLFNLYHLRGNVRDVPGVPQHGMCHANA